MRVKFEDGDLRRPYEEPDFRLSSIGQDLTRAYRKVVGLVAAASDERDLRAMRSLHFEKLEGDRLGQHSLRLNKQWRLVFRLEATQESKQVVVIEVTDYH